jgi:hypothetical protein
VAGQLVVRRLKVDVDIAPHRREGSLVLARPEAYERRFLPAQFELNLDLRMPRQATGALNAREVATPTGWPWWRPLLACIFDLDQIADHFSGVYSTEPESGS